MFNTIKEKISKRMQTTFIGAISRFETEFGYLWGHEEESPSPEQQNKRNQWERLRKSILDHGNQQLRQLLKEIKEELNYGRKY